MYIELVKYPDVFLRSVSNTVPFPLDDKTSGDIKEMWKNKWYELVKQIGGKINESKRLSADSRKIH